MKLRALAFSIVIVVLVLPALAAKNPMKPGKWKVTTVISGQGADESTSEPRTDIECVTREDIEDLQFIPELIEDEDCEMVEYTVKASTITWDMKCSDGLRSQGKMVFSGDTYKSESTVTAEEVAMTLKITGKYLGPCDKK